MPPREKTPQPDPQPAPASDDAERVVDLERENAELRRQLDAARLPDGRFTTDAAPARRPYFNEAMREELDRRGWTVDPTTGAKLTEDPRDQVADTD